MLVTARQSRHLQKMLHFFNFVKILLKPLVFCCFSSLLLEVFRSQQDQHLKLQSFSVYSPLFYALVKGKMQRNLLTKSPCRNLVFAAIVMEFMDFMANHCKEPGCLIEKVPSNALRDELCSARNGALSPFFLVFWQTDPEWFQRERLFNIQKGIRL